MCTFLVTMVFIIDLIYENKMNIIILCVVCLVVQNSEGSHDPEDLIFELVERQPINRENRVLLCLNTDKQLTQLTKLKYTDLQFELMDTFPELNIEYHLVEDCRNEIEAKGNIIDAVIAPKPLPLSSDIPMYFFDIPYLEQDSSEEIPKYLYENRGQDVREVRPDVDAFPNGLFPLRDHWQSLKFALSHYLSTHGWKRIAIVSDYSYYSQAFEMKLVEHLKETGIVYKRQWCTRSGCSFSRAMKYLKRNKAFIIIANIQGENAEKLIHDATQNEMTSNRYVWLVRDWPFGDVSSTREFHQMVSLTLSPLAVPEYKINPDVPHLNSVWRGLALVSAAIKSIKKTRLDYYYKSIYNFMNTTNKCDRSKLYIHKFESGELVNVNNASTWIYNSGRVGYYPKDTVMAEKVSDLAEFCLQRSNSFENPCDDNWIVVICVVWLMFIIMVVLLIYFFNRCLVWT